MVQITLKRVYDAPEKTDGFRILVDRLWPRGIKKTALGFDLWPKAIAPSNELRKWVHEDIEPRWSEFSKRYQKELDDNAEAQKVIAQLSEHPMMTLLYAAKDTERNHAIILQYYLQEKLETPGR